MGSNDEENVGSSEGFRVGDGVKLGLSIDGDNCEANVNVKNNCRRNIIMINFSLILNDLMIKVWIIVIIDYIRLISLLILMFLT